MDLGFGILDVGKTGLNEHFLVPKSANAHLKSKI